MVFRANKQDKAIELIKSIAIILVVLGHINTPLGKIIYSFHMPLFFMISGTFISGMNSFRELRVNTLRLIVPAFIFFLIAYLITLTKNMYLDRDIETLYQATKNLFFWTNSKDINNYGFVLWFLIVLFWGKMLSNSLIFKNSKFENHIIIFSILVLSLSKNYFNLILPFGIDIAIFVVPFMLLGYLTYKHKYIVLKNRISIIIISQLTLYFIYKYYGIMWVDIGSRDYENYSLSIIYSYLIYLNFFIIFNTLDLRNKIFIPFIFIGEISFYIMIFHPYSNNISDKFLSLLISEYRWPFTLLLSIILCVILYILYDYALRFFRDLRSNAN